MIENMTQVVKRQSISKALTSTLKNSDFLNIYKKNVLDEE